MSTSYEDQLYRDAIVVREDAPSYLVPQMGLGVDYFVYLLTNAQEKLLDDVSRDDGYAQHESVRFIEENPYEIKMSVQDLVDFYLKWAPEIDRIIFLGESEAA